MEYFWCVINSLGITLVQTEIFWEQPQKNLDKYADLLSRYSTESDIYVLPEMFSTGFSMRPEILADGLFEQCVSWMSVQAKKLNAVLTGSTMCSENGNYFNRLIWMQPDATFHTYDKKHLFSFGNEEAHYAPGHKRIIIDYKGWRICPLICYDLRFPVWCRNNSDFDLLLFVANWPDRRIYAWDQLLIARAIENVCYVAGVNIVGNDGRGLYHSGHSSVIDFTGKPLLGRYNEEMMHTAKISKTDLEAFRQSFRALDDRDQISPEFYGI